ncbi:MAG: fatty acid--CoA ligase family protein [Devosia sp.]|nr:fatty acid--CoA ligase family protein [Devosia sp.]
MQLAKYVIYQARMREDEPAIAFAGGVATYGLLVKGVAASVEELRRLGLRRGDIVALHVQNPFHHAALILALALTGQVSASIMGRAQVEFSGVTPAVVLTDRADFELPGSRVVPLDDQWFVVDPGAPADYAGLLALPGFADPGEVVRVVFSSGTTGYPKAVGMTLGALEQSCAHGEMTQAGPHQHAVRALNMMGFSTSASIMALLIALGRGGLLALASQPDEALRLIRAFRIEIAVSAVVQLQGLLKALGGAPPPTSLRTVIAAGARISPELLLEARARLCPNLNVMYGSTEGGPMTFGTGAALERHEGSAGYVLPWVAIETVDTAGQRVPFGQDGVIRVKSAEQCFYLVPTPETDAMFRDGWFYPGDVGRLDADGLLSITGRVNEVINRGGVIVAPDMVEEVLRSIAGVKDVAVFGAPDRAGVEEIWAAIVSDGWVDGAAIRQVAAVRLPDRAPDRIVQVDAIPRNEMGKIRRNQLRDSLTRREA